MAIGCPSLVLQSPPPAADSLLHTKCSGSDWRCKTCAVKQPVQKALGQWGSEIKDQTGCVKASSLDLPACSRRFPILVQLALPTSLKLPESQCTRDKVQFVLCLGSVQFQTGCDGAANLRYIFAHDSLFRQPVSTAQSHASCVKLLQISPSLGKKMEHFSNPAQKLPATDLVP